MVTFGSGTLYGLPNAGDLAANPTPMKFGTLQEVQVDFSGDIKELYGQYQYPVDTARGKIKITWKAKAATMIGKMINDIFFAETLGTTAVLMAVDEAGAVPAAPTYIITVANAAKYVRNLGVYYASTGLPLTQVAPGGEALGKYSVNSATGVYTFAAADANAAVLLSYEYNATAGSGFAIPITNHLMGFGPVFMIALAQAYKGKVLNLQLNACRSTKLALATKQDDYTVPEFDGSAFADASGNVGNLWLSD